MRLFLDASAAMEVALNRDRAPHIATALGEADEVLAPDLLLPEVVNGIWKEHQFGKLELDLCDQALAIITELVDSWVPSLTVYREAFLLSRTARRPAYDMFYLALARREDAILLTLDSTLKKEARRQGIRVA